MTEADIAYTAGLIDGEGSISLAWHRNQVTKEGRPSVAPALRLQISMTHKEVIQWLHATWGVGFVGVSYRPRRPNHSIAYSWKAQTRGAEYVLKTVLPYLKVKQPQALLGLESRSLISPSRKIGFEEMKKRYALREQMILLNKTNRRSRTRLNVPGFAKLAALVPETHVPLTERT